MKPTQGISFPRSGHAAVYKILESYYEGCFVYCDIDNNRHCGCRSMPCINPQRTFAKNHDFGLRYRFILRRRRWFGVTGVATRFKGDRIRKNERYLVQYRTPVPAIASNFRLHIRRKPHENHVAGWRAFALKDIAYWNRFVDKWILEYPERSRQPLYCSYEQLIAAPEARVREILTYTSKYSLDEERVRYVMKKAPILPRHNLRTFEFSDTGFFKELEALAFPRLERLNLPSFTDL
jgi:hypothetical protein